MIVLHGSAKIGETVSTFTIGFDNKNYEIIYGNSNLHDNVIAPDVQGAAKTDGTSTGEGATVRVKIKTSNVSNISLNNARCIGSKNTLIPSARVGALSKEEYLAETSAFISSARVDFSVSSVGYDSPRNGLTFTTWLESDLGDSSASISIEKESEDAYILEYSTKEIMGEQSGCDWSIVESLELDISVITKGGAISSGDKLTYSHIDALISSAVTMEGSRYLTFDSDISAMGGWWESSDVAVRRRVAAKVSSSTMDSMFLYLIFGKIAPQVFSSSIRKMIFTASRYGDNYELDTVLASNTYEYPDVNSLTIASFGPEISGSATIIGDTETGTISIHTGDVTTAQGEMHIEISGGQSVNTCKFQMKAGFSPTAEFLGAGVDARFLYNQVTGRGLTTITGQNADNEMIGFHLLVDGLEEYLAEFSWDIRSLAMAIMTRGISCLLSGNMIDFIFFLLYEGIKMIFSPSERTVVLRGMGGVQERYMASMAQAQQGMDATTRKKVARQWLEMLDIGYMRMSSPSTYIVFTLQFLCAFIPFTFQRSLPFSSGIPMYGIPMKSDFIHAVNTPDHILTDETAAMIRKNSYFNLYKSRVDWGMILRGELLNQVTSWAWGGTLITIKRDGKLQELYAADDPSYSINGVRHFSEASPRVGDVETSGEIGERWNEYRVALNTGSRLTHWHATEVKSSTAAEAAIQAWTGDGVPANHVIMKSTIINLDDSTVSKNGGAPVDAIIHRPNDNVIIAFKKEE